MQSPHPSKNIQHNNSSLQRIRLLMPDLWCLIFPSDRQGFTVRLTAGLYSKALR
nr:MAG TPA: hypothetical protein [Caudoviricetes sp.]